MLHSISDGFLMIPRFFVLDPRKERIPKKIYTLDDQGLIRDRNVSEVGELNWKPHSNASQIRCGKLVMQLFFDILF